MPSLNDIVIWFRPARQFRARQIEAIPVPLTIDACRCSCCFFALAQKRTRHLDWSTRPIRVSNRLTRFRIHL